MGEGKGTNMLAAGSSVVRDGLGKAVGWLARRPAVAECAGCRRRAADLERTRRDLEATRAESRGARQAESGARREANYRQALWCRQARERAAAAQAELRAQAELERVRAEAGPQRVAELERQLAGQERTIKR